MTPFVADPVYLNGQFLPLAEAGISPLDRGFLYGDGVYEVIPVYSRRPFRIEPLPVVTYAHGDEATARCEFDRDPAVRPGVIERVVQEGGEDPP